MQWYIHFMCVWMFTCWPREWAISLADSGHLAEGFRDRHCLLSTVTLVSMPRLWCPCYSLWSPFTPEETLWMDERGQAGDLAWLGLKRECKRGVKKRNHCCQLAKPSRHISSFYWARIQINILLLTKLVGLMNAVALPRVDHTHHHSWGASVHRNISCDGVWQ